MQKHHRLLLFLCCMGFVLCSMSQQNHGSVNGLPPPESGVKVSKDVQKPQAKNSQTMEQVAATQTNQKTNQVDDEKPSAKHQHAVSDDLVKAGVEYQKKIWNLNLSAYARNNRMYETQDLHTWIILCLCIFIVLFGLFYCAYQFHSDHAIKKELVKYYQPDDKATQNSSDQNGEEKSSAPALSSLKVSLQGIEVSSSVIGILVLSISLVFFFLYIRFAYPINSTINEFSNSAKPAQAQLK